MIIFNYKKKGRQVVNPAKIPVVTPPIKRVKEILRFLCVLFIMYQRLITKSKTAPNEAIATQ